MKKISVLMFVLSVFVLNAQLMDMPEGISYWELVDGYFVSCWQSANVVMVNSEGVQSEYWSGLSHCANNLLVENILYVTYGSHVKAIDIFTNTELWDITLSGALDADGIAMADDGFLYVVTHNNKVYKINVDDQTSELFAFGSIGTYDQGMVYDAEYNRLLICSYQANCPIFAVNLPDGDTCEVYQTGLDNLDAMATDTAGNIYVTCSADNSVYRFNNEFTGAPVIVSDGHQGPSGIEINEIDNLLYVSNFFTNTVDVVQLPGVNVEQENIIQSPIKLHQNYPNPFNPSTTISFNITAKDAKNTKIEIHNLKGQKVKTFDCSNSFAAQARDSLFYSINWNGTDENNHPVSSGIYLYKLKAGKYIRTKKMILMK